MNIIKQKIKRIVSRVKGKSVKEFDITTDYVSFDIFDTLVLRNCEKPEDIFRIIDRNVPGFFHDRTEAEKHVRQTSDKEEVTLNEIYKYVQEKYGYKSLLDLMDTEISTEITMCVPNREMINIIDELIENGKKIFLISDMYLPEEAVRAILKKCNIVKYDKLYISCEYRKTKRVGSLFQYVLEDNNITSDNLTHIGDNPISDFLVPRRMGINAILYRKEQPSRVFLKALKSKKGFDVTEEMIHDYQIIRCTCVNSSCEKDNNYLVGNHVMGPMLYGFSEWLHRRAIETGSKKIFFLSREGKILKDCYSKIYGEEEIKLVYINVSRISLCRACFVNFKKYDDFQRVMRGSFRSVKTVNELINILGIANKTTIICSTCAITPDDLLDGIDKDQLFLSLQKYGKEYFLEQSKLLEEYLYEKGMDEKDVFIVDIGWTGTMQLMLSYFHPDKVFIGNYISVSNIYDRIEGYFSLDRNGFWNNAYEWDTKGKVFRFSLSAIEELFMSIEGTTIGYYMDCGCVQPLKKEFTYGEDIRNKIESIHRGINDFLDCYSPMKETVNSYVYMWPYMNFAVYPSMNSVEVFKGFTFESGVNKIEVLPTHSIFYYLWHINETKDILEKNVNKILWMKALIKIPFPYFKFLCFLTDRLGMRSKYQMRQESEG